MAAELKPELVELKSVLGARDLYTLGDGFYREQEKIYTVTVQKGCQKPSWFGSTVYDTIDVTVDLEQGTLGLECFMECKKRRYNIILQEISCEDNAVNSDT
jgi:hypothetical protein